jgi:hypothetical protein
MFKELTMQQMTILLISTMKWVDLRKNFPTQLIKLYNMIENFTITNYWIIGEIKSSFDKMTFGR